MYLLYLIAVLILSGSYKNDKKANSAYKKLQLRNRLLLLSSFSWVCAYEKLLPQVLPNKKATYFVDGYKLFRVVYYSERIPKHKFKHPFALICFKVLFSALCILLAQVIFTKN